MFFWPKKIITLFFLPLHFALFAGAVGAILLLLRRRERLARLLLVVAIAVLAIFSNRRVASLLIAPLESHHAPIPELSAANPPPPALAACRFLIVLGGGHGESPGFSRINQLVPASQARLAEGVRIFRQLPAGTRFVVSGHAGDNKTSHAQIVAEAAISLGVPPEAIVRFDQARDTHDEALALCALAGDAPVAIVTSAWHMPRAIQLCQGVGLNAVACPADFMLKPGTDSGSEFFAFDIAALERSTKAIHEYLGLLWSHLRGQT